MFTPVFLFRPLPDGGGTPDTDVQNTCKVRYKFPQIHSGGSLIRMIPSDLKGHVGYEVVPIISAICYRSVISLFLGEEMMAEDCYFREDILLGQGKYIFSGKDCITPME